MNKTFRHAFILSIVATSVSLAVGCGGGKEEEEAPAGSLADISGAIESPTGTLDESTASDVARAFEESNGVPTSGTRDDVVAAQAQDVPCGTSGNISVTADSSGEAFDISYDSCCEGTCCFDGTATGFVDTSGTATYTACYEYDLSSSCDGVSIDYDFSFCSGVNGIVYSIEVNGDTFSVSGSTVNGTGTLTVTGENGTFTCEYTDYAGSCTGDSGTFSF